MEDRSKPLVSVVVLDMEHVVPRTMRPSNQSWMLSRGYRSFLAPWIGTRCFAKACRRVTNFLRRPGQRGFRPNERRALDEVSQCRKNGGCGRWPITIRTAEKVGEILRHLRAADAPASRYAFYI
jgi:hypothetical protein